MINSAKLMRERRVGPGSASQRVPQQHPGTPTLPRAPEKQTQKRHLSWGEPMDIDGHRWTMTFLSETSADSMVLQLSINIFHEYYPISSMMDHDKLSSNHQYYPLAIIVWLFNIAMI